MQISFDVGPSELPPTPPYHLLVLGDFDPSAGERHQAPIRVARGDFPQLLDRMAPELALDIDNLITGGDETWWVRLQLRSLKDFTPAGLIRLIPELDWIDALRRAIDDVATGKGPASTLAAIVDDYSGIPGLIDAIAQCRAALAEPPPTASGATTTPEPPPASRPDDGLSSLFDMVETPQQPDTSSSREAVSRAIAAVTGKPRAKRPRPALATASQQVTALLQAQLRCILGHPRFRALEQTWRGLHWLLAAIGGDAPVDVQILPRSEDTLAAAIGSARPTDAVETAPRFNLVLCDIAVGPKDLDLLRGLAESAESAMTPVLVSLDADFFASAAERPLSRVRDPANLLDQPVYQRWNALRDDDAMRWLAACFNDALLRAPYAAADRHSAGIAEPDDPLSHGIWGHAGWLVARRIAEQQQQRDWPVPITGAQAGRVPDLPLFSAAVTDGLDEQRPLRHALSPDQSEELGTVGILALACAPGQDSAWIISAPSLIRIQPQTQAQLTRALRRDAGLPAQLLRARLVHCVLSAMEHLPDGPAAQRAAALERYAVSLVAATGDSAGATAQLDADRPEQIRLTLVLGERVMRDLSVELLLA